jgi:hypothetical protein
MKTTHVLVVVLLVSMLLAVLASIKLPFSVNRFEVDPAQHRAPPAEREAPVPSADSVLLSSAGAPRATSRAAGRAGPVRV